MNKSPSINYYSFFTVKHCIYSSKSTAVLIVEFNLYDQSLGYTRDAVLKVKYISSDKCSRETEISEKVSNFHPLFPEFYYCVSDDCLCFLFTEYCSNSSLDK